MSDGPCGSRGGHSYTASHRKAYEKRQAVALLKAKEYYIANASTIKANRMARYYRQKELRLAGDIPAAGLAS